METIDKMKRQPMEQEKTFANHRSDISKIYDELIHLNNKKQITSSKTRQKPHIDISP